MTITLSDRDRARLAGEEGEALALAMRLLVAVGEATGADRFIDVSGAHIDSCLYHGDAGLDFAEHLARDGVSVSVPTTLNVASLDLLHPEIFRGDDRLAERGRRLMEAYVALGCAPTWTCAPYQLPDRPGFGEHVAWAESNAIVFANSVLGARTDRYGDFIDISAALTGRVPESGLHRDEERLATVVIRLDGVHDGLLDADVLFPVLGFVVGRIATTAVPAVVGLPSSVSEDRLKALGAAAASSGGVGLVHVVGVTPEAPDLDAATGGRKPVEVTIGMDELRRGRDALSSSLDGSLTAVSVGTPHASADELRRLVRLLDGRTPTAPLYVNTGRDVLETVPDVADALQATGVTIVTDTCTYITPILERHDGIVLTDSAKWAYYAPANLGVEVAFGSIEDCVESAVTGSLVRDDSVWT